ncbi:hypothetical protein MMC26_001198 [Xylographa opegraphella]|nr:hypothetical protein [Xylographa opegraphella]
MDDSTGQYESSSKERLKAMLVGKELEQIPAPAAVVDRAVVRRNCSQMLAACDALGVSFRPHIKTHKTIEVTRLQVGDNAQNVNIIVSTVMEAEYVMPYLRDCQKQGKTVNVLYGIPLPPSQAQRLGKIGSELGPGSISVMIDNSDQLSILQAFKEVAGFSANIFIKIDAGYGRAGLDPNSGKLKALLEVVLPITKAEGFGHLSGFYSHAGHSYGVASGDEAMGHLSSEIENLIIAASLADKLLGGSHEPNESKAKYVLSVGATPSATSIQHLVHANRTLPAAWEAQTDRLRQCIVHAKGCGNLEIHAGVYPFLDNQQLATQASLSSSTTTTPIAQHGISFPDIALTILAEVASLYMHRNPPEALIAAGSLALGREACKSYGGWGVVSDWSTSSATTRHPCTVPTNRSGWEVARISQEHGILQRVSDDAPELKVGSKLRVWPNHACVAGASFDFYVIVDSDSPSTNQVVDVWTRCRGW